MERADFDVDPGDDVLIERATRLAREVRERATSQSRRGDRSRSRQIAHLLQNPSSLAFVMTLTDEVLRIDDPPRAARRFRDLVGALPDRDTLGLRDTVLAVVGARASKVIPGLVMKIVRWRVHSELSGFVIGAEPRKLAAHLRQQARRGYRTNINLLGESVMGDAEAQSRREALVAILRRPDVHYVSVKVSSICARINPLDFDDEVERIAASLRRLYDTAMESDPATFVNLDMEEYRDLEITVAVFKKVLGEERYRRLSAGIVLQAYIPDSTTVVMDLVAWARARRLAGGAPIKVRVVKGANLAMEEVRAELAGWPAPTFSTKSEVDANYKAMLDVLLDPRNAESLRVGVASHNVFEICWAFVVATARGLEDMVEFEMLQGMSPSTAAAVREMTGGLLLYTPIVHRDDATSAIAYLIRRFDENTGTQNYLRNQFHFDGDSAAWTLEQRRFTQSVDDRRHLDLRPQRSQDRGSINPRGDTAERAFRNEPDTDFSLLRNRTWIADHLVPLEEQGITIIHPSVTSSDDARSTLVDGVDPADPTRVAYRWVPVSRHQVDRALEFARDAARAWNLSRPSDRRELLDAVASTFGQCRGELISVMTRDAGKTVAESDTEVSEAIDFARYYAQSIVALAAAVPASASFENRGVVLVVPPWNFPLAIPMSGVCAALAGGNAVILKPAPETVAVAWRMVQLLWRAGVARELVQFLPSLDDEVGEYLVSHQGIDTVILTGSWDSARLFIQWRPDRRLLAETSGKNAIIVTASADLEEAVADVVRSAFGHSGQKCSACSLLILEESVYEDERFRRQLVDAAASVRVGAGWDLRSDTGPLIRAPQGDLAHFLDDLDPGESWWLRPTFVGGSRTMVTPAIKGGVRSGAPLHLREAFGPVLGVMRARDLDEAIRLQNATPYGLTAGLHSLDPREVQQWIDTVEAGNLYVNRHITGAIVQRQSFGGWKRSNIGDGAKSGGPNYVASMLTWSSTSSRSPQHFAHEVCEAFESLVPSDLSGLRSESNVMRYRKLSRVIMRLGPDADVDTIDKIVACAHILGVPIELSSPHEGLTSERMMLEDGEAFVKRICQTEGQGRGLEKVRLVGRVGVTTRSAALEAGFFVDDSSFVAVPRLEALRWVREQSWSMTSHRHGNIVRIPVNSDSRSGVFGHPAVRSEVAWRPTSV